MGPITRLGDRLLARFVPKTRAHADVCHSEYACKSSASSKCRFNLVRLRRLVCTSGAVGTWRVEGCCF